MDDLANALLGIYICVGLAVGASWPIWVWFLAN